MGLSLLTLDSTQIQMPTEHGWVRPAAIGRGGRGNDVIPAIWSYVLRWNALDPEHYKEIWDIANDNQGVQITAELPEHGADPYALKSYTVYINEPTNRGFMEGHYLNVETELVGIDITA